jgi:hypothetical protein
LLTATESTGIRLLAMSLTFILPEIIVVTIVPRDLQTVNVCHAAGEVDHNDVLDRQYKAVV